MKHNQVISFPRSQQIRGNSEQRKRITNTDGIKYYSEKQIKLLRRTVRNQAEIDKTKGNITAVKEWMAIDILTSTGVRVSEAANIRCGDCKIGYGSSEIFIREGKGSKSRHVQIPASLKKHLKQFLRWKPEKGESTDHDAHLFIGQRGEWTSQAVQQIVKKYLKQLGLYEPGKSCHALRHSYAVQFYRQQRDLRALMKQLGHANIQSTQIYADVLKEDIHNQLRGLWN